MSAAPDPDRLAATFRRSLDSGAERGALCLMHHGSVLLDLQGGAASAGVPWSDQTLACCFSVTKGVVSLLAHVMIERGMIALDTRVAEVWPDFAVQGKAEITLAEVLGHRAGLAVVGHDVAAGDLYDWDRMCAHLERSAPTRLGEPVYHNMTYGHLLGETLRRAAGAASLPKLLRDLVTGPLDAEFHLGLDDDQAARAATLTQDDPGSLFIALREQPQSLFARSMSFFDPAEDFNSGRWRRAVIGSGSGHATARALASLFGQFIWPGGLLSRARRLDLARGPSGATRDPVLGVPLRLGQGIELSCPPAFDFGPGRRAVGHWGAGGAQAFADPETGLSFAYVTGRMSSGMGTSPRAAALVAALYPERIAA